MKDILYTIRISHQEQQTLFLNKKIMNKKIIIGAIIGIVGIFLIYKNVHSPVTPTVDVPKSTENQVVKQPEETTQPQTKTNTSTTTTTTHTETQPQTFTLAQVATHNSETSCYSAINGKVYDLGAWINQHPGGDRAILGICGKDGSSAFNGRHGGQARPEAILAGFEIGILK